MQTIGMIRYAMGILFCRFTFFVLFPQEIRYACRRAAIRVANDPHVPQIIRDGATPGWSEASEQARTWAKQWQPAATDGDIHLGVELYYYGWIRAARRWLQTFKLAHGLAPRGRQFPNLPFQCCPQDGVGYVWHWVFHRGGCK